MNKKEKSVLDKAQSALGLDGISHTSPKIIEEILEEMQIVDLKTTHTYMSRQLKEIVKNPQDLRPLLKNIKESIGLKHPAILKFVKICLKKQWLDSGKDILKVVHRIYVLELLTAAMCNSHVFFIDVQKHFKKKEKELGIDIKHPISTILHLSHMFPSVFKVAKILSVEPTMVFFRLQKGATTSAFSEAEAKALLREGKICYIEYLLLSPNHESTLEHILEALRINIYEAGILEYKEGLQSNAICAHVMSEDILKNPPKTTFKKQCILPEHAKHDLYQSILEKDNLFPVMPLSQEWVSLYEAWNMTCVVGTQESVDVLLPKLLIPSVLDARSENYVGARAVSLWITINYYIFLEAKGKRSKKKMKNHKKISKAWAEINKDYAMQLEKHEIREDVVSFEEGFQKFFQHPLWNFCKLLKRLY